jgi:hypothetical protein
MTRACRCTGAGLAATAVVSMALLIAGVADVANGVVHLRRFRVRD